uniref:Secreted protein n=1 Tax=Heterorhabditis bacteriophora TaxID=37862 RepID=A0A1I7WZJ9_HETBA
MLVLIMNTIQTNRLFLFVSYKTKEFFGKLLYAWCMLVWLILLIAEHSCRPVAIISMTMLNETRLTNDFNSTKSLYKGEGTINGLLNPTKVCLI